MRKNRVSRNLSSAPATLPTGLANIASSTVSIHHRGVTKTTITPDEVLKGFGDLLAPPAKTHREFETNEGLWRPGYEDGRLLEYRLFRKPKGGKKVVWRPRGR